MAFQPSWQPERCAAPESPHLHMHPHGHVWLRTPQERGIYAWSTASWRRRVLLSPDPKYANKKLAAGLMVVSAVRAAGALAAQLAVRCLVALFLRCTESQTRVGQSAHSLLSGCAYSCRSFPTGPPAAQGQQPTVYWTPLGKNTVRMVHTTQLDLPKGAWGAGG